AGLLLGGRGVAAAAAAGRRREEAGGEGGDGELSRARKDGGEVQSVAFVGRIGASALLVPEAVLPGETAHPAGYAAISQDSVGLRRRAARVHPLSPNRRPAASASPSAPAQAT